MKQSVRLIRTGSDGADAGSVREKDGWERSPCSSCPGSPCCRYLPVTRIPMENREHLLQARSLLSHHRIELGLHDNGTWMVYYASACRFLDPVSSRCTIHGSGRQPGICRDYSARLCWYRTAFAGDLSLRFIRFDRRRFEVLSGRLGIDDRGEIARVPSWEQLLRDLASVPREPDLFLAVGAAAGSVPRSGAGPSGDAGLASGSLVFPLPVPLSSRNLDFIRFRLGFAGTAIGVHREPDGSVAWRLILDAPCREGGCEACRRDLREGHALLRSGGEIVEHLTPEEILRSIGPDGDAPDGDAPEGPNSCIL